MLIYAAIYNSDSAMAALQNSIWVATGNLAILLTLWVKTEFVIIIIIIKNLLSKTITLQLYYYFISFTTLEYDAGHS